MVKYCSYHGQEVVEVDQVQEVVIMVIRVVMQLKTH